MFLNAPRVNAQPVPATTIKDYQIINDVGAVVQKSVLSNDQIDIHNLSSGHYTLLTGKDSKGIAHSIPFIKN
ncbi:MAG: hypothetical protein ABI378_07805 [Chitinophagaceae bacterium]